MKNFLFILSIILFISCNEKQPSYDNQFLNKTPQTTVVNTDNIQYDIIWNANKDVDIRIITLEKNGRKHDYIVGVSYVGRGGGISIDHWKGCDCNY